MIGDLSALLIFAILNIYRRGDVIKKSHSYRVDPMPQIEFAYSIEISDVEIDAIADTLSCVPDDVQVMLEAYAKAALQEYREMLSGQAMVSVTDLRERRLVSMLQNLPPDRFPTDEQIARIFNLTSAQGRGLLRATLSRHRSSLKQIMDDAARRFVQACNGAAANNEDEREARFPNAVIIELLNAKLAAAAAPRSPIRRKVGTFDTYVVSNGAFLELQGLYT